MGDMDLPYESNPGPVPMSDEIVHYSGGVVVMASVVDVPDVGPRPALVFRFSNPIGQFYEPIVLVCDDDQIAKLRPLINSAIADARRAADLAPRSKT